VARASACVDEDQLGRSVTRTRDIRGATEGWCEPSGQSYRPIDALNGRIATLVAAASSALVNALTENLLHL
jgi:hypothetical protein